MAVALAPARKRPSPLVTPRARGTNALTGHFTAPTFAELLRWPGFPALSPLTRSVLQYICTMLDGRRAVIMPARQVAAELQCSVRSVRTAYQRLRVDGLVLTTETQNARGGSSHLCFVPGPVLARLAGYTPPTAGRRPPFTPPPHKNAAARPARLSRVFRGEGVSPPSPVRDEVGSAVVPSVTSERSRNVEVRHGAVENSPAGCRKEDARPDRPRAVECSAKRPHRRVPCRGQGPPADPQSRIAAALEAALGAAGPPTPADRRMCRVVARIAVTEGLEAEALRIAAYAGRVRWCRCRGALLRQRFVDALDRAGAGDSAVPPQWQHLRRSEAARVDRAIPDDGRVK
jgi:hypothetical protein